MPSTNDGGSIPSKNGGSTIWCNLGYNSNPGSQPPPPTVSSVYNKQQQNSYPFYVPKMQPVKIDGNYTSIGNEGNTG